MAVMGRNDPVHIAYDEILIDRKLAILLRIDREEVWIPKSQVLDEGENWVEIPEWLALEKSLI